jgi:hypothetical protein
MTKELMNAETYKMLEEHLITMHTEDLANLLTIALTGHPDVRHITTERVTSGQFNFGERMPEIGVKGRLATVVIRVQDLPMLPSENELLS